MSFDDKKSGIPHINVHKRTTRVNIWMAVAVTAFFLFGALVVLNLK